MPSIDPKRLSHARKAATIAVLAVGLVSIQACGASSPPGRTVTVFTEAPAPVTVSAAGACDVPGYTDTPPVGCPAPGPGQGHDGAGGMDLPGGGRSSGEVPQQP